MTRLDEAYRYQITRAAALQSAAAAPTMRARVPHFRLAGFACRSARLIGAVA